MSIRSICLWFVLLVTPLGAQQSLVLRGHLGEQASAAAIETLERIEGDTLVVEVSSSSGDLYAMLDVAKKLYEIKQSTGLRVIVYIDDEAVGPGAIIPFLADELYISLFVSWGDLPAASEKEMPTNLLRSRVLSLIPAERKEAPLLKLLADAMIDPAREVAADSGSWKLDGDKGLPLVSPAGETLVVNQNQLRTLGLIKEVLPLETFKERFFAARTPVREQAPSIAPTTVEKDLAERIRFSPDGDNTVGHILIDDKKSGISESTWIYVKSALDYYKETKPKMIILQLNTPGGQVYAAQKISDALYEMDQQYNIPVVAFIDNWAISAGAMLAYSCRFIAVVKDAAMGAAEPIIMGQGKMETASEKINSALRTDFANRARLFDRDALIASAMVDKDMVLVERYGRIVQLTANDDIVTGGARPDRVITREGKLLTLSGEEMVELGVADILVPRVSVEPLTGEEEREGDFPTSKSLLFKAAFFKDLPPGNIDGFKLDWRGQFFAILTHPAVASLLFLGLMLGAYIEISTPGFGLPGSVAVICLLLMGLSSFALEAAGWLEVILIGLGATLVAVDLLFIPTFGLLGIVGALFLVGGLFGLLLPGLDKISYDFDTQTVNAAGEMVLERLAWLGGALIVGLITIVFMGRYVMPKIMVYSKLMLQGEQDRELGFVAGPEHLPEVGAKGVAETSLRPAGKVRIGNDLFDAVSAGTYIERNTPIKVSAVDGNRVIVDINKLSEG